MSIHFSCNCGKRLVLKDEHAGHTFRCPVCKSPVVVPDKSRLRKAVVQSPNAGQKLMQSTEQVHPLSNEGDSLGALASAIREGADRPSTRRTRSHSPKAMILGIGTVVLLVASGLWVMLVWMPAQREKVLEKTLNLVEMFAAIGDLPRKEDVEAGRMELGASQDQFVTSLRDIGERMPGHRIGIAHMLRQYMEPREWRELRRAWVITEDEVLSQRSDRSINPGAPPATHHEPRLPADFAFIALTEVNVGSELNRLLEPGSALIMAGTGGGREGITLRIKDDFITGLRGKGLFLPIEINLNPSSTKVNWTPQSFACYRSHKLLGVWDTGAKSFRSARPEEAPESMTYTTDSRDGTNGSSPDRTGNSTNHQSTSVKPSLPTVSKPASKWHIGDVKHYFVTRIDSGLATAVAGPGEKFLVVTFILTHRDASVGEFSERDVMLKYTTRQGVNASSGAPVAFGLVRKSQTSWVVHSPIVKGTIALMDNDNVTRLEISREEGMPVTLRTKTKQAHIAMAVSVAADAQGPIEFTLNVADTDKGK